MGDAPRMPAWRHPAPMPSKQVQKPDRRVAGAAAAADVTRLARPPTAAQSLGPGSAEGVPLLPAPWPLFPHGNSTPQASTAASALAGDGDTALRPAIAADTQHVRHRSQRPLDCKDAAVNGRQQRSCRRVLSSDGSLGSFMRAEAAASATPGLASPPPANRDSSSGHAVSEPLQTDHDADICASRPMSVKDNDRGPRMAHTWPDSHSGAEIEVAATADTHSAVGGMFLEQTAPQARTKQEHPSAHTAALLSGEVDHRAIAQTRPADAGAAAEMWDTVAGGSLVPVGASEALFASCHARYPSDIVSSHGHR